MVCIAQRYQNIVIRCCLKLEIFTDYIWIPYEDRSITIFP